MADDAEEANRQGVLHCKAGAMAKGAECFRQAIRLSPEAFQHHLNLGSALNALQQWPEAEKALGAAFSLAPNQTDIHKAMATTFVGLGKSEELMLRYQTALAERPQDAALARNFCTVLLQLRKIPQATKMARQMVSAAPRDIDANLLLADCLENTGQLDEAIQILLGALEHAPRHVPGGIRLGIIQSRQGNYAAAAATFETVLRIAPNHALVLQFLGDMRLRMGQVSEAILLLRRALGLEPNSTEASRLLASALAYRGSLEEAGKAYRTSLAFAEDQNIRSNYVYTLSLIPSATREKIFEAHKEWGRLHGTFAPVAHANRPGPERRLKIGYLSPDLREHSIAYFLEPLLQAHDRQAFEVVCYADGSQFDATSQRLKDAAHGWRAVGTHGDDEVMRMIQSDGIDILIDLAGHTGGNRLSMFARKPAPVQISWLGYPETTGVPAMDYKITDAMVSPPNEDGRFSTENLLRLPNGFHCYRPPPGCPEIAQSPCLRNGFVTFGSFSDLPKVTPQIVTAWSAILRAAPGTRLLMKCRQFADETVRDKYRSMFEAAGIASERVTFAERSPTTAAHLAHYSEMDIALDTFPYNGTTTICEALWMGVPVVTMTGERAASRVGASLMRQAGLPEMIADNIGDFVAIATSLAADTKKLDAMRSAMRERLNSSAMRDETGFARAMETAYRTAWRNWCTHHPRA